jgi:AcrR family transcriptional regulator
MATKLANREETKSGRSQSVDKRQAIVEAAGALFTTEGYESTTIADVARRAGVAVGTVYLYFKNKIELLLAVKGDWEREFLEFMARPELQTIPHHLRARPLIEACFTMATEHTESVQLLGVPMQIVGELYHKEPGLIESALQGMFDEAVAAGSFRPVDTHAAAAIAYGMVHRALDQCFCVEEGKDQERYIATLVDVLERWLVKPELLKS